MSSILYFKGLLFCYFEEVWEVFGEYVIMRSGKPTQSSEVAKLKQGTRLVTLMQEGELRFESKKTKNK